MGIESDSVIPFLDVLIIRKEMTLATKVYRKTTHTGWHLIFRSIHLLHVKNHNRASTLCQERQDLFNEISSLRCDLQLTGYPQGFIGLGINSKGSSHRNKEQKPLGSVYIPYMKGVSEKFKCIGNRYNIRAILKTKHTLMSSLMKIRPERDPQQTAQCICSIPRECGRSYIGETGRPLAM
jgi:hypothetical protein